MFSTRLRAVASKGRGVPGRPCELVEELVEEVELRR
jgi:hypothetical protein